MVDEIEYDECGNIKKKVKDCKYFHQDPYRTPNNYDLYFDYNSIPANIEYEGNVNLIRRLKKHLPLSKLLHLNMETKNVNHNDEFTLFTKTKVTFKRKNSDGSVEEVVVNLK